MLLSIISALLLSASALRLAAHHGLHSITSSGLHLPMSRLTMSDPDTPPEVNPTRRDPDEPGPDIPIRLPVVDFGWAFSDLLHRNF